MIEHLWSVLCRSSSIDQETNSVSLFNTLDSLVICGELKEKFTLPMDFEVTSLWCRSQEDAPAHGAIRITMRTPDQKNIVVNEMELELDNTIFYRSRLKFPGLPVSSEGSYSFMVEFKPRDAAKWSRAAVLPLFVKFEPAPVSEKTEPAA